MANLPPTYSSMEIPELEERAEHGQLEERRCAMRELVVRYSPVPSIFTDAPIRNTREALRWVEKLVDIGDWQGRHWLADYYFSDEHKDTKRAIQLLETNAKEGEHLACVRLAYYFVIGKAVDKDFKKAVEWLTKIVSIEDTRTVWHKIPDGILKEDRNKNFWPHRYFDMENVQVRSWEFCREFTYHYEEPRYKLAELYLQGGFGIEQDFGKAVAWLEKAVEWLNIPWDEKCRAQFELGKCYLTGGPGLEKNYAKAIEWFAKVPAPDNISHFFSARWGGYHISDGESYRRQAKRQLGICYALGKGVEQNFEKAREFFEKAARISWGETTEDFPSMIDSRAEAELGICFYRLGDIAKAHKCFERSAEQDDVLGNLWLCYLNSVKNEKLRGEITYVSRIYREPGIFNKSWSDDERKGEEIDRSESKVYEQLTNIAARCDALVRNNQELDLDMLSISNDVLEFLIDVKELTSTHPSKVILAFYHESKNDEECGKFLENAASHGDIIATYHLAKRCKYSNSNKAEELLQRIISNHSYNTKENYDLHNKNEITYLAKMELKDISHQKEIEAKNMELEDMMSMFSHKFRSPLDTIIYNTTHDNKTILYVEAAQTMRGLLDIFSIISTDEKVLKNRLKEDNQGPGNLMTVFGATLDMIMLHLLSTSGSEKIQQHYMAYANEHGLCDSSISRKKWNEDFFELEKKLQTTWQQSYAQLLNESVDLKTRLHWLEQHFFKLELIGLDKAHIQFREYGITASFLTILFNEILVNAFKYYFSTNKQPVILEWVERNGYQVLSCRNPSIRRERTVQKGSGKGHVFLSALARKTGSIFLKPKPQDDFVLDFSISNEIWM